MLRIQIMKTPHSTCLTVRDLDKVARFERYEGVISGVLSGIQTFSIIFHVKYKNGSRGNIYGGLYISGELLSETQLRELLRKIGAAKALLRDEEWQYLEWKYGVKKEEVLVLTKARA